MHKHREKYKGYDISLQAEGWGDGLSNKCAYHIAHVGHTLCTGVIAGAFKTVAEAEDAALASARSWIDRV